MNHKIQKEELEILLQYLFQSNSLAKIVWFEVHNRALPLNIAQNPNWFRIRIMQRPLLI